MPRFRVPKSFTAHSADISHVVRVGLVPKPNWLSGKLFPQPSGNTGPYAPNYRL
jgi:hypothetical protein